MVFYHGTNRGGLTELKPFYSEGSNLKEACVYLSTSRRVALFYIWDYARDPVRRMMMDIQPDKVVFQEMFPGALERFYKGVSGYIYRCEGDYEMREDHGVKTCAISREPVPVAGVEVVEDVYREILKYQEKGEFVYERYEELPQYRYDIIRGIVMRMIVRDKLLENQEHPTALLYQEVYPRYWKEAKVLAEHGLL